jgi:hypothetical protein
VSEYLYSLGHLQDEKLRAAAAERERRAREDAASSKAAQGSRVLVRQLQHKRFKQVRRACCAVRTGSMRQRAPRMRADHGRAHVHVLLRCCRGITVGVRCLSSWMLTAWGVWTWWRWWARHPPGWTTWMTRCVRGRVWRRVHKPASTPAHPTAWWPGRGGVCT